MARCGSPACSDCSSLKVLNLKKHGIRIDRWDYVVALAGNPNTGKSTIFNALTGLRQHTGNWPGKTITRAEGGYSCEGKRFKLVDLPGTYSLLSASQDEEVARDFVLFGQPDVTVVVLDATRLERNLNLVLQVLQITDKVVVCLNLMDEAKAHGLAIDSRGLARDLGVPVVPTVARRGKGINLLIKEMADMATGVTVCRPHRPKYEAPGFREVVEKLAAMVEKAFPEVLQAHWIALRLLEGDKRIIEAVSSGKLGRLDQDHTHVATKAGSLT